MNRRRTRDCGFQKSIQNHNVTNYLHIPTTGRSFSQTIGDFELL